MGDGQQDPAKAAELPMVKVTRRVSPMVAMIRVFLVGGQ